jgi:Choline/Carnitine o-acyltransferase
MLKDDESLPEIYTDPAFGQSNHWELSTSQLSSRYLDGWGYGEGETFYYYLSCYMTTLNFSLYSGTRRLRSVIFNWR